MYFVEGVQKLHKLRQKGSDRFGRACLAQASNQSDHGNSDTRYCIAWQRYMWRQRLLRKCEPVTNDQSRDSLFTSREMCKSFVGHPTRKGLAGTKTVGRRVARLLEAKLWKQLERQSEDSRRGYTFGGMDLSLKGQARGPSLQTD